MGAPDEFRTVAPGTPGAMGWAGRPGLLPATGLGTQCVHGGASPDPAYGAVAAPIYETSNFAMLDIGTSAGFEYSRTSNPTRARLEEAVALLEGGCGAICTSTGMSGIMAVLGLLEHGSHVLCPDDCYGGTFRALAHARRVHGLETTFLDLTDPEAVAAAIRPETRLIWAETPSNPLLRLLDLAALARVARERDLLLAVDNTFLSPVLQRPLRFGAHLVFHSTTKYLNGHSDVVGGAVVAAADRPDLLSRLAALNNTLGTSQSPHDCALVLRGLKTLHLRMRAHEANARALASYLAAHPAVARVNYPGLPGHPQHLWPCASRRGSGPCSASSSRTAPRPRWRGSCGACAGSPWPKAWAGWRAWCPSRPP